MEILFWSQFIYCHICARTLLADGKTYEPWQCERCGTLVAMGIDYYRRKGTHPKPFTFEII